MKMFLLFLFVCFASPALAGGHGEPFYQSAEFYVAVSFLLVVFALAKPISKTVMTILYARVDNVLQSIQDVVKLRDDAKITLSTYQEKQKKLSKEIEILEKEFSQEREDIKKDALAEIDKNIKIKEKELLSKIGSMEYEAKKDITEMVVEKTIEEVKTYMQNKQDKKNQEKLVAKAIDTL